MSEILDAVGIWLMRQALALNVAIGNPIIDRLPAKFKTRSSEGLDKRFAVLEQLADTPAPNESTNGFQCHQNFFIGRPGTTEEEVNGSDGVLGVKPKTMLMNTDEFIRGIDSFFGAITSTRRSFNPRILANTIFTNLDRKRKRESEGKGNSDATASKGGPAKKLRKETPKVSDSSAQSAESSTPETGKSKANETRNVNNNDEYKIPRVVPGQVKSSGIQKTASLQTQGSQLQPPLLNSNNPSYPSNRSRGRGIHHQSRNNTNQHHGNSRFIICNSQNGSYTCTRRVYEGANFCPGCRAQSQYRTWRGENPSVRRGGRALGRGRGRGNFRGGNTGTHRGTRTKINFPPKLFF